jgi:uncharacterized protein (TIGR02266 family)
MAEVPFNHALNDLEAGEGELTQQERRLGEELDQLAALLAQLNSEQERLRGRTQRSQRRWAADPGLADLARALQPVEAEEQAAAQARAQVLDARRLAIDVRRQALAERQRLADGCRPALATFRDHLGIFAERLASLQAQLAGTEERLAEEERRRSEASDVVPSTSPTLLTRPASAGPRERPRVVVGATVTYQSESNFYTGFSSNLSDGGVFIATLDVLPVGTAVDLTLSLPGHSALRVHGVVVWVRDTVDRSPDVPSGIGVRFSELSAGVAHVIRRFVARREPLFYPD